MNKKYLLLGLLIGTFLILGLSVLTNSVKGLIQNPDNLIWNQNISYENENYNGINPDYNYNIRNKSYFTGYYPSHFDFRNEVGLINDTISFVSLVENSYYAEVIPNLNGHNAIIYMNGTNIDNGIWSYFEFSDLDGIIEFWLYKNCSNVISGLSLYDGSTRCIHLYLDELGNYEYLNNVPTVIDTGYDYFEGIWTHHSIQWYNDNTFDWTVNGFLILDGGVFYQNQPHGIDTMRFFIQDKTFIGLDAVGIDDLMREPYYSPNDNVLPEKVILNDLEVDRNEFDYDYDAFENDEYNFYEGAYSWTTFVEKTNDINSDLVFLMADIDETYTATIYNYNIGCISHIVNYSTNFTIVNSDNENFYIYLQPYNGSDLYKIRIASSNLYYENIYTSTFIDTGYNVNEDIEYQCNILLDYNSGLGSIIMNNELVQTFPILDDDDFEDSFGLYRIRYYCTKADSSTFSYIKIHSVGIYDNGSSIVDESIDFGILSYDICLESSLIIDTNLLDINFNQDCSVYNYNNLDSFFSNGNQFLSRDNYTDLDKYNLANNFIDLYTKLIFVVYENVSYPSYLEIEGVCLLYNSESLIYPYDYSYFHSESIDNYFYVENNHLYYHFNNSDSVNPEYMRIRFSDIDYEIKENYSIGFNSFITGNYSCRLRLTFYDYSYVDYIINKSNSVKYSEYLLPEGKKIFLLTITISVDEYDTAEGITEGYIDIIHFGSSYDVFEGAIDDLDDSLLDLDFIEGIVYVSIILIFLIIPCYLVYERYGKKVVLPMFILIVIVLMISTFLPIWLSIILLISAFLFLYHSSKRDVQND